MAGSKRSSLRRRRWRSSASARASSPPSTSRSGSCAPDRRATSTTLGGATEPWSWPWNARCRVIDLLLHVDGHRAGGRPAVPTRPGELDDGFTVRARQRGRPSGPVAAAPCRPGAGEPTAARPSRSRRCGPPIGDPVPTVGLAERLARRRSITHAGTWSPSAAWRARTARSSAPPASARACRWRRISTASRRRRERRWDSCFRLGFGRVAGDANFRPRGQRPVSAVADAQVLDLVGPVRARPAASAAAGASRACPVGIDVREELAAIAPPMRRVRRRSRGRRRRPQAGRPRRSQVVAPARYVTAR